MEKLNFNSGILRISLNKYDDVLELNSTDLKVFQRFVNLYDKLQEAAGEASRKIKALAEEAAGREDTSEENIGIMTGILDAKIMFSKKALDELDGVFGEGFTGKVFRENYELDPDFVPDELIITELLESMIPIMEKAYGERMRRHKSKYSAGKRGKHSKTKDELIAEYQEKKAADE